MNLSLCSTSCELAYAGADGLRCRDFRLLLSRPFLKEDTYKRKCFAQIPYRYARKSEISSQLKPQPLEGSFMGINRLEEPRNKLEFVRTLLIDNYDSYTYNIYQELSIINGLPPVVVRNDEWTLEDLRHYVYEVGAFDNIVISPGPGSPTCPKDIGICLQLLRECWDIPILGVCLGHQALGYVHGAQIVHAHEPVHGRLSVVEHNGCRLFSDIPSGRNSDFKVVRYHSLVIDAKSLPKELIPIAWTCSDEATSFRGTQRFNVISDGFDTQTGQEVVDCIAEKLKRRNGCPSGRSDQIRTRNVLMGIMHSSRPHYGLQFHPESVATCHGRQIFKNFREITEDYWLRFRSSVTNTRNFNPTGKLEPLRSINVTVANQVFKELSRCQTVDNTSDLHCERGPAWSLMDADKRRLRMVDMVNLSYTRSGANFLKLEWRKFDHLASEVGGARNIFCELFGDNKAENTFWLDSSSTDKGRARFSFMGGKGGYLWKQVTFRLSEESVMTSKPGGHLVIQDAQGTSRSTFLEEGFLDFLNKELLSFCYEEKDYEGLPFDFHGGYVGYMGYDLKIECGVPSNRHKSRNPDACFFFADNLLVVDHDKDDIYILSIRKESTPATPWLDATEQKLISLKGSFTQIYREQKLQKEVSACKPGFLADKSRHQYIRDVQKCLEYIKDGESYELCLTTQIRKHIGDVDSLGLYLHLRDKNPAPYAAYLNFAKENLQICSSSPERFLRLDRNGNLEAKPIKGTIARGSTKEEDNQLKSKLQCSEKDQAENLMIVDLLRNDLGRVCEPGTVHVPNLMDVESYATVHTMVSTIRGKKQPNISAVDCISAAFPGGSMTGAPKLRSMDLLDSLESCSRGIYSGSIGFFSYNGTFDLNIVIRTVVIQDGEASIGAGGAIVALSNSEDEYDEMILKARAPSKAVMEFLEGTN